MKRFLTIAAILLVVGFVVAKNRQMCSYVCTTGQMLTKQLKGSVSPEFEIERLKNEIAKLDGDVDRLIQDEATLTVDLKEYRADLAKKETALAKTEESLLTFAKEVKSNPDKGFVFTKASYTPVTAKKKLADDFDLYKSQKGSVQSLKNLIGAKEKQYNSLLTHRTKIATQKLTYQAQLDQLSADWATLKNDTNASTPNFDSTRFAQIEQGLKDLKRKVEIEKTVLELKNGMAPPQQDVQVEVGNQIDPDTVLSAIQNQPADKTVKTTPPQND